MEQREEVDATSDAAALTRILDAVRAREAGLVAKLSAAFCEHDLAEAARLTTHLSYLFRLEQAVVHKL